MKPFSFRYESMGTHWEISLWDKITNSTAASLEQEIIGLSSEFDAIYSRFIGDSFISELSKKRGIIETPGDFVTILREYEKIYKLSGKKFTPLIGNTLADLGYDKTYSLQSKSTIRPVPDLDKAVEIIDESHISIKEPVLFDFGALGKGFFVEKIKKLLLDKKFKRFLVNGSGDIAYVGNGEEIQVGLEHPFDSRKVIGSTTMKSGSMCSSGINRRAWGEYHHIIDPQLLKPAQTIAGVWVIADSATIADGLATALFLCPPEVFQKDYQFEYLIVNTEMKVKRSQGFKAQLY